MLWTIIGILIVLWLLGFIAKIGGALIHILLIAALVLFIFNLITGKKTR
ncbi:lmo0937 family membrane protein [Bacillus sp. FJAT-49711]|nr:lmo0937 family membrane protein [Bacillus sp. FJAT-49711]MBS4220810.1 lmo0937 family membrane protein [Bacillus sp. FJAT-49711]